MQVATGLNSYCGAQQRVWSLEQVVAGLCLQHSLSQATPSSRPMVINCSSLCSSYQEAPSPGEAMAYMHQTPSQEVPDPPQRGSNFRLHQRLTKQVSKMTHLKGRHSWHQSIVKGTLILKGQHLHNSSYTVVSIEEMCKFLERYSSKTESGRNR